jgi:hypothetical protein
MITLDEALDVVNGLLPEQREMLTEILRRRQIEERRAQIAAEANSAMEDFRQGRIHAETAEDLISRLRSVAP